MTKKYIYLPIKCESPPFDFPVCDKEADILNEKDEKFHGILEIQLFSWHSHFC